MALNKTALVGHVGRSSVSFALTDSSGALLEDSVRTYEAARHATISAALMAFKDESGLTSLPRRSALAVAGVPRGDTISVTSSRWFVSKAGLAAILQRPPLVLNDFAAIVWAVVASGSEEIQPAGESAPVTGAGTFAVVGTGSGLGVAAFIRGEDGEVTVIPTEAGHSELVDSSPEIAPVIDIIRRDNRYCSAESLLSADGLKALYNAMAELQGSAARAASADEVTRSAEAGDELAVRACTHFAKALWRFAGNLTLVYGAWDGIFLTGPVVGALRAALSRADLRQTFAIGGPYANLLRKVPAGFLLVDHAPLRGAAEALRRRD